MLPLVRRWLPRLLQYSLGLVFVAAGVIKVGNLPAFAVAIGEYGLVWDGWTLPLAVLLAGAEVAAGLATLAGYRGGLAVLGGLMCLFMAVLGYGLWLGLDIECGCLGPHLSQDLSQTLAVDAVLLAAWVFVVCSGRATTGDASEAGNIAAGREPAARE